MDESILGPLGISPAEERVYRFLIGQPKATRAEISRMADLKGEELAGVLASLEAKGLVSRLPDEERNPVATRPDVAVEALISRRQGDLERCRLHGLQLLEQFQGTRQERKPAELIEVVSGREALGQRFVQLQQSAREEMLILDKPPYATLPTEQNEAELELLRRGVDCRAIYDADGLSIEGRLPLIEELMEAGESARVLRGVPMKLAIADRRVAIVPLSLQPWGMAEGAILVHASALLDSLAMVFDLLWQRATPIESVGAGQDLDEESEPSEDDRRMLTLLVAGVTDETIARQLGLSVRTVRRRVHNLMDLLAAGNRFQLGAQAVRRGWV